MGSNSGPQREYIVHYLHIATADAFIWSRDIVSEAIKLVPDNTLEDVLEWRSNVEYLLENPKTFRKEDRSTLSTIKIYDSRENCSEFEKNSTKVSLRT